MKSRKSQADVSVMTPADITFAFRMTEAERWGYLRTDFEKLIAFEPKGCFIAREQRRRVGMVTSTTYGTYAFVGSLIVETSRRNRGIGEKLLRHALAYLEGKGIKTAELDGVFEAAPLYRRLGFTDKYLSLRFFRRPAGISLRAEAPVPEACEGIVDFDLRCTGIERGRIIRRYLHDHDDSAFVIRDDPLSAYAFVRPRSDGTAAIGPLVAVDDRRAESLISGLVVKYAGVGLSVGVPVGKHSLVRSLLDLGFEHRAPSLRMYRGDRKDYEQHIYAILSPEKG
jgi:ribosomal protein S18 acetylase RimI-like enzyme